MKRSKSITLVLLGTTALVGCSDNVPPNQEVQVRQQQYASKDDCTKEWGTDSRNCTTTSTGHVYGPRYFWNHSAGYPMVIDSTGAQRPMPGANFANPSNTATAPTRSIGVTTSKASVPTTSSIGRAVAPVARGGFGSTGSSFSAAS
jgi:hypothetical protein